IANLIEAGACLVNGDAGRAGYRLAAGDLVEAAFEDGAPTSMSPENIPLEIVFEDDQIVVVVKPAGMLVHPTKSVKSGTLANALAYHLNRSRIEDRESRIEDRGSRIEDRESRIEKTQLAAGDPRSSILDSQSVIRPGLVHRLDRATSGLMVIAKTPRALAILSKHFRKRLVEKRYVTLVHGEVETNAGSISAPIGRDPDERPQWRVMEEGKQAETKFTVLERLLGATLLELEPVTGRTNQLRIHCAHIGHPIVGDEVHCGLRIEDCGLAQSAKRLCLHAAKLAFHHPSSGEWLEIDSLMPDDFRASVESFRKAAIPAG
ncbi:MAG TPA: RluA family pseudouridine synthase, partial [Blastocatellia bacterium]|nr:RluA family pseudouridine synthase [Blastocatellia bacterium]